MFPSKYIKAGDCEEADLQLTIAAVKQESIGQGDEAETKFVVYFDEHDKGLVLNKTNANIIAEMFGDDTDAWINREITLHVQSVEFQGKIVPSIRVKMVNEKEAMIQRYWVRVRELGLERADGLKILKECNEDFAVAFSKIDSTPY